jgi:hypothetical protein
MKQMRNRRIQNSRPLPSWEQPVEKWLGALDRYVAYLQTPAWRATVKRDGSEKPTCLSSAAACLVQTRMKAVLDAMARRRSVSVASLAPAIEDLVELSRLIGRHVPRADRCPSRLHWHFQRAYLLNQAGYRCRYCGRTAWGVYAQGSSKMRRTLRFEVDHRITRRRLKQPTEFDLSNLSAICRSCNVIKAEMPEDRFLEELESLAASYCRSRNVR